MSKKGGKTAKVSNDADLQHLFNKMVGAVDPELDIALPKFVTIMKAAGAFAGILQAFLNNSGTKKLEAANYGTRGIFEYASQLQDFVKKTEPKPVPVEGRGDPAVVRTLQGPALTKYLLSIESQYMHDNFVANYLEAKKNPLLQHIVHTYRNIRTALVEEGKTAAARKRNVPSERARGENCLANKDNLCGDFIINSLGDDLQLFSFSSLNCKAVLLDDTLTAAEHKYFLSVLYLLLTYGNKVVAMLQQPDVDVDQLAYTINSSIQNLMPQLPGCELAFREINNSVGMFKSNFDGYYKDFLSSNSPGIIIESFISDVGTKSKSKGGNSILLRQQFNKILNFYRQRVQMANKLDPRLSKIVDIAANALTGGDAPTKSTSAKSASAKTAAAAAAERAPSPSAVLQAQFEPAAAAAAPQSAATAVSTRAAAPQSASAANAERVAAEVGITATGIDAPQLDNPTPDNIAAALQNIMSSASGMSVMDITDMIRGMRTNTGADADVAGMDELSKM